MALLLANFPCACLLVKLMYSSRPKYAPSPWYPDLGSKWQAVFSAKRAGGARRLWAAGRSITENIGKIALVGGHNNAMVAPALALTTTLHPVPVFADGFLTQILPMTCSIHRAACLSSLIRIVVPWSPDYMWPPIFAACTCLGSPQHRIQDRMEWVDVCVSL